VIPYPLLILLPALLFCGNALGDSGQTVLAFLDSPILPQEGESRDLSRLVYPAFDPAQGKTSSISEYADDLEPMVLPDEAGDFDGFASILQQAPAPMYGYKNPALAWLLSFFVPGLGQLYIGTGGSITLGVIHLGIHAALATALFIMIDEDEDVGVIVVGTFLGINWLINWIDALIFARRYNRRVSALGAAPRVEYDPATKSLGVGVGLAF
jgi:hypothetical protein